MWNNIFEAYPQPQIFIPEFDLFDDSSDSSDENEFEVNEFMYHTIQKRKEPAAVKQCRRVINRNRKEGHKQLMRDYFDEDCVYPEEKFEDRYRVSKRVMLRIAHDLSERYPYFTLRYDARGRRGFTTLQKVTAAFRMLAYGKAADALDEYLRMSERVVRECVYLFSEYVLHMYGKEYLRNPTRRDVQKLYEAHEAKYGFPGMLGSIDTTHVDWERCPYAWKGQYTGGHHGKPSVILEGVVSCDYWFWHAFFGMPGSCNDINVLNASNILENILQGKAADLPFVVDGRERRIGYYLGDGIYPNYTTFVKSYAFPADEMRKYFKVAQEAARKDVECAFGHLKGRWQILKYPVRTWDQDKITTMCLCCVILHNMIIEDEGRAICNFNPEEDQLNPPAIFQMGTPAYISRMLDIQNAEECGNLREDLARHLWNLRH